MPNIALDVVLERMIPPDLVPFINSGIYDLGGGVVRIAKGFEGAGRIVRHLVPVAKEAVQQAATSATLGPLGIAAEAAKIGSEIGTHVQLGRIVRKTNQILDELGVLKQLTQQVLTTAQATMVVSGLNLAVSAVGFAVLKGKLDAMDKTLVQIAQNVKAIKALLVSQQYGRLTNALKNLEHASGMGDDNNRHSMLHQARQTLGELTHTFDHMLAEAETLEEAVVLEELYTLCALALARTSAELGMAGVAREEIADASLTWHHHARRIARDLCFGDRPGRFLTGDYVKAAPVAALSDLLDFAYDQDRGTEQVDDLRLKRSGSGDVKRDTALVLPTLYRLRHRSHVLDGYEAQYRAFEELDVRPSAFDAEVQAAIEAATSDGQEVPGPIALVRVERAPRSPRRRSAKPKTAA